MGKLTHFNTILGFISILGFLVVLYMGYGSIRTKGIQLNQSNVKSQSLLKGIVINAISPHPYLFWFSVGSPLIIKAMHQSVFAVSAFAGSFYLLLVGSKIVIAVLIGRSQFLLNGKIYTNIMRFLGIVLFIFAFFLLYDGLKFMGLV